uniref:Uncharacterized protein n=1 Tax=Aegilops tauschii TaxID=37682 RepID=N1QQ68_AEGTA
MEEEGAPALRVIRSSIDALGRGFDATHDTRLLYCKGSRLVDVDDGELSSRDLVMPDGLTVPGVPKDVDCSGESGVGVPETAGPCAFHECQDITGCTHMLCRSTTVQAVPIPVLNYRILVS